MTRGGLGLGPLRALPAMQLTGWQCRGFANRESAVFTDTRLSDRHPIHVQDLENVDRQIGDEPFAYELRTAA